ncbi:MAG: flavodoxin family protein [Deltaproteobacteria bacterium]|nr:flavodoxin family protein [Deltaproteobacteria bacterium]
MADIIALYGSPRRKGNTATLLDQAVAGAIAAGANVEKIVLRDYRISPCLEIYGCKKNGECSISDDFQEIRDRIIAAKGLIIATPIFFYTVSAHVKIFMDRCQSLWVKKYWIDKTPYNQWVPKRKGLIIAVGATKGKKLFDGMLLTMRYFFDVLDMVAWDSLLFRGLDHTGDVLSMPAYLDLARKKGGHFAKAVMSPDSE